LYSLLQFRLNAMDRRTPALTGLLAVLLGTLHVMEADVARALLIGVPIGLFAFVLTSTNHARSQEDLLRRIEELEMMINHRVGENLLGFQSSHPSRATTVGGRTATLWVRAIVLLCVAALLSCTYMFVRIGASSAATIGYLAYCTVVTLAILVQAARIERYRYAKRAPPAAYMTRSGDSSDSDPTNREWVGVGDE
jgi:hypothetical protein